MTLKRIAGRIGAGLSDAIEFTVVGALATYLGTFLGFMLMGFGVSPATGALIMAGLIVTTILTYGYLNGGRYTTLEATEAEVTAERISAREESKLAEDPNSELWKSASSGRNEW